ncbi:MAG: YggS family pyridoxal phosphate-dependent enzyme [Bacteroidota bacterium]
MNIAESISWLKNSVPDHIGIVAVSKTKPISSIMQAYHAGQRIFGENKVQEIVQKQPYLPSDIEWHFIGHLQTNKVKYIAPFISLIQSIDSLKLLSEINFEALKNNRIIDCLLQFHIATEETKYGLNMLEAASLIESESYRKLKNIRITGVMGMSTFSEDFSIVRKEFALLHDYYHTLKSGYFSQSDSFRHISMGMSGDYNIAIEEGSTLIRLGTIIFGDREQKILPMKSP